MFFPKYGSGDISFNDIIYTTKYIFCYKPTFEGINVVKPNTKTWSKWYFIVYITAKIPAPVMICENLYCSIFSSFHAEMEFLH